MQKQKKTGAGCLQNYALVSTGRRIRNTTTTNNVEPITNPLCLLLETTKHKNKRLTYHAEIIDHVFVI